MASALRWIPDTLYNYSLAAVAANYNAFQKEARSFPEAMLFDIYYQLYKESHLKKLGLEFSNLDIFKKLLKIKDKRCLLHNCFQAVMDHGCPVASELAQAFHSLTTSACSLSISAKNSIIHLGFALGNFLIDAGWFPESEVVFCACLSLCYTYNTSAICRIILQCHTKLLCIRTSYCKYKNGKITFRDANECIDKIKELGLNVNFASIYGEFSAFYFSQHNYHEAYRWSMEAVKELNSSLFPKDVIRVLCQASKACILKRKFKCSEILIKQALLLARETFGSRSLVFARTLVDYGYYLLNIDSLAHSVKVYQTALNLHICVFGGNNLLVAKCHEDLACTSYSYGYNNGHFKDALDHADKALSIMLNVFNEDNFSLASVKKIKALILEEIGLDSHDLVIQKKLFLEAKELHSYALRFADETFGTYNMYTAKCHGNLGRLFQSMNKYKEAQNMQLKAIEIKETIVGPDDYEVGLSVGHLASLYTYDMELHKEAEVCFLRSIDITKRLFGDDYSGLEYDYRGLLRVYTKLGDREKALMYRQILHSWKELRDQKAQREKESCPLKIDFDHVAPEDIMSLLNSVQ